ncbi:MAG: hypothetical protein PF450_11360, partial [Bacteroidales bacterium]|nr:hypothetical protein [Bacteroidales bacterium]
MLKYLLYVFLFCCQIGVAQTYYVSQSEGNDLNTGLSPDQAWKTTSRINLENLSGNDSVLLKRGDKWSFHDGDCLMLRSGWNSSRLVYGAYGSGPKPILSRAIIANDTADWVDQGNNIWKLKKWVVGDDYNTAFISYNNASIIGHKKFDIINLLNQGDFYTDEVFNGGTTYNVTYAYSIGNPADIYESVHVVVGQSGISSESEAVGISNVIIENIEFFECGWCGIAIPQNSKNILIDNCDVSYAGGQRHINAKIFGTRRGQCINTQGSIENYEVRNCRVSQGWDGGIALQGWVDGLVIKDVWIHHNIIYKNEFGLETWASEVNSDISNVNFENNTCLY